MSDKHPEDVWAEVGLEMDSLRARCDMLSRQADVDKSYIEQYQRQVADLLDRIRLLERACQRAAFFIRHYGDMDSLDEKEVLDLLSVSNPASDGSAGASQTEVREAKNER